MNIKDYAVRRLFLPEELEQIRTMQERAPEFLKHYPRHIEWLTMALDEILIGRRIAFGVVRSGFNVTGHPTTQIVGSIILKRGIFSGQIELKNLFIREDSRLKGYGHALYMKAEDYCSRAGCTEIETEVPCDEIGTIHFLHRFGFHVKRILNSPYKAGDHLYQMTKSLVPWYTGDPFDLKSLAFWVLERTYGFSEIVPTNDNHRFDFQLQPPTIGPLNKTVARIDGAVLIYDYDDPTDRLTIERTAKGLEHQLVIVFCHEITQEAAAFCNRNRFKAFDRNTIAQCFNQLLPHSWPSFPKRDVAGMLMSIKGDYFARISKTPSPFTYVKSGPVGKFLKPGNTALFLVETTPTTAGDGLRGLAEVHNISVGHPTDVWQRIHHRNLLFSKPEYEAYTRDKIEVLAVELINFRPLPLLERSELTLVLPKEVSDSLHELDYCYISADSLNAIQKLTPQRPHSDPDNVSMRKYAVTLSFAGEDREHAEALAKLLREKKITVFYDKYETADLWGKDLYQHLQSIYRDQARFCVIFISAAYAKKLWTKHELKQAQARAFQESKEYILPLKLDDTEVPGINPTVGYIDLRSTSLADVVDLLIEKLRERNADA